MPQLPQMPANAVEETESLFVPLFRKGQFVLGDLHGEISPNGLGLRMMSNVVPGLAPVQIARRFCVDLSICDAIEFLEYESFSDGNVIVSMHSVDLDGDYSGISIVLDCSEGEEHETSPRAVSSDGISSPLKVVMRINYTETVDCDSCHGSRSSCPCSQPRANVIKLTPNGSETCIDWASWVSAFASTRTCVSTTTASFRAVTPMGELPGVMSFRLQQTAEMGEESGLALIRRRYEKLRASQVPSICKEEVVEEASGMEAIGVEESVFESMVGPGDLPDFMSSTLGAPDGDLAAAPKCLSPPSAGPSSARDSPAPVSDTLPPSSHSHALSEAPSATLKPHLPGGRMLVGGVRKKVFVCDCGVEFSHRGHLNVHIMTKHRMLKPHLCTECTARFAKRSDLRRHVKTVHCMDSLKDDDDPVAAASNKPFPCGYCDKRYVTRQGARKHLNSKHPEAVLAE